MIRPFLLVLTLNAYVLMTPVATFAQTLSAPAPRTPALSISLDSFQRQVLANHPELVQARNDRAQARRMVSVAKGAFDPKVSASLSDKRFKYDPYYALADAELSVPTYIGADFKLGFERGVGDKVNPQSSTPSGGLLKLGVSIPLGRDMITDERRTLVVRARAMSSIADADVVAVTNKLLLNATKAYAEWYLAHRTSVIADSTAQLAEFRLLSVRARIQAGEIAPIDSIEALLELRRRRVLILEAQNQARVAALDAYSFLWAGRGQPEAIAANIAPVLPALPTASTDTTALSSWLIQAQATHPAVLKADGKIALEAADWRLNAQGLLPDVDVTISTIANGSAVDSLFRPGLWDGNYKRSATGSTSLLLRKERGKLATSTLKLESARLERDIEQRRVSIDIQNSLSTLVTVENAIRLQRENVAAAGLLRDAEEARFASGESTLLSVNLRERLLFDELLKLEQFNAKLLGARVALMNARGVSAY